MNTPSGNGKHQIRKNTLLIVFVPSIFISIFATIAFMLGRYGGGFSFIFTYMSYYALINGLLVSLIAFIYWFSSNRISGERNLLIVMITDLRITKFSTIGIISLMNTIWMGFALGASTQLLLEVFKTRFRLLMNNGFNDPNGLIELNQYHKEQLILVLLLVLSVLIIRLISEADILIFRVAQKYLDDQPRK